MKEIVALSAQIFNDYIGHIQKACQQTVYALFWSYKYE